MEKILITGGSGLLGSNIAKLAAPKFETTATYYKNRIDLHGVAFIGVDLTWKEDADKISELKPGLIIHTAALTNIDYCEEHPKEAHNHNVLASRNIAAAAKKAGAYLIHISTDCVFDGESGNYKEEDKTGPINVYGKTKLEAEQSVLSVYPGSCVVRTNIYGWNTLNKFSLAEWMIDRLETGKELPGFQDVRFSPILVNDLAQVLFELYQKKYEGILHAASREACSKLEFAQMIAEVFGYDAQCIKSVSYRDVGLRAPRGQDMSLDTSKARSVLGRELPDIRGGLERMKQLHSKQYVDGARNE